MNLSESTVGNLDYIEQWLNTHINNKSEASELSKLLIELKYLVQILPKQYEQFFISETKALLKWLEDQDKDHKLSTEEQKLIYDNGINKKEFLRDITDRYVIAFLNCRAESEQVNQIRSLYFFLCLRMVQLTDYDSRIKTTLDECRHLTSKKRRFLAIFLPDIVKSDDLEQLIHELEQSQNHDNYTRWNNTDPHNLTNFAKEVIRKQGLTSNDVDLLTRQSLINQKISEYIYRFILPVENFFQNQSGVIRVTSITYNIVSTTSYIDDESGNSVADLSFTSNDSSDISTFEAQERQDDENESLEQVIFAKPTNYYLDIRRAEQQVNCRHQRTLSQVTDVNVAHPDNIQLLLWYLVNKLSELDIKSIQNKYNNDNYNEEEDSSITYDMSHQAALYLLMLLLTGMPEIFLSNDFKMAYKHYQFPLKFKPVRSEIKEDWDDQLCAKNEHHLKLILPKVIGYLHINLVNSLSSQQVEQIKTLANDLLKELNKKHRTRLTNNKIQNYLTHRLIQDGRDQALINVLTNQPVNHLSALPYFNASQLDIYLCQSQFIEHLSSLFCESDSSLLDSDSLASQFFDLPEDKEINYWDKRTGSVLAIDDNDLSPIIVNIKNKVLEDKANLKLTENQSLVEFHNSFMDYLYIMLAISTGYRPVKEPFGRLSHIDIRTKKYFISDKENHQQSHGRFIYLPDIVNAQIEKYIQFLERSSRLFNKLDHSLGDIYEGVLKSQIGLITYLKADEVTATIRELKLTQSYILQRQTRFIKLPLNWPRHFIRSYKDIEEGLYSPNHGIKGDRFGHDVVSAWMGHADELGFDFYNRYSGLKRSEMKRFAEKLNQILLNTGFMVLDLEDSQ